MTNYQLLKTSAYYTSLTTLAAVSIPIMSCIGAVMLDKVFKTSYLENIDSLSNKYINIESLDAGLGLKKSSDIIYNDSSIYYGNSINKSSIKQDIINSYQKLEQDSVLKYFMYVNALHSISKMGDSNSFYINDSYQFISRESLTYKVSDLVNSFSGGQRPDEVFGIYNSNFDVIQIYFNDSNFLNFAELLAHEMTHMAYNIVYDKLSNPYSNSKMQNDYLALVESNIESSIKSANEQLNGVFKDLAEARFLADMVRTLDHSGPYLLNMEHVEVEIIAVYLEVIARGDIEVASKFIGFKEYIEKYTIPDFIEYIESHPDCNKIDYSNESIVCKVVGDAEEVVVDL